MDWNGNWRVCGKPWRGQNWRNKCSKFCEQINTALGLLPRLHMKESDLKPYHSYLETWPEVKPVPQNFFLSVPNEVDSLLKQTNKNQYYHYTKQSIDSMQSLSSYQRHFSFSHLAALFLGDVSQELQLFYLFHFLQCHSFSKLLSDKQNVCALIHLFVHIKFAYLVHLVSEFRFI